MNLLKKELIEVSVNEEKLNFKAGVLTLNQDGGGLKTWKVAVDGAEAKMVEILRTSEKVALKMITIDNKVFTGSSLATDSSTFLGTGVLNEQ